MCKHVVALHLDRSPDSLYPSEMTSISLGNDPRGKYYCHRLAFESGIQTSVLG